MKYTVSNYNAIRYNRTAVGGAKKNAQGILKYFIQPPSKVDIQNAGHRTNYVFGKSYPSKVYIYDGDGIKATIPTNLFISPKN